MRVTAVLLASALALAASASARGARRVEIRVLDARTGAAVEAIVHLEKASSEGVGEVALGGGVGAVAVVALANGEYLARAEAPGYIGLEARMSIGSGTVSDWTFLLEPAVATSPFRAGREALPGEALIAGRVVAAEDGAPIAGARVAIGGERATTGDDGGFEIGVPAHDPATPADLHPLDLEIAADGRRGVTSTVLPFTGRLFLPFALAPGEGFERRRDEHRLLSDRGGAGLEDRVADEEGPEAPDLVLEPPALVRVGFGDFACTVPCCTAACTSVCILPLETYVARGLNDEWIASWAPHSLRAGAIAYRSYAAYRVDHPMQPEFDLCSSACCQVNDPDRSASTDAAVAATPGILLERQNAAFQAEYSAENNSWDDPDDGLPCSNADLSCGDGFVGSPAFGWPCLADAVALGRGCFGHGRGMSQWGSKRWSDPPYGDTWKRILDHYYNADGNPSGQRSAFLASPVRVDFGGSCPRRPGPGARVELRLHATDLAGLARPDALFGASLESPSGLLISDPDHDRAVPLVPGGNFATREFDLPTGAELGSWDLWLALWDDVDEDGEITSADLGFDLRVIPDALEVEAVDLVFADCFEGGDTARWSGTVGSAP